MIKFFKVTFILYFLIIITIIISSCENLTNPRNIQTPEGMIFVEGGKYKMGDIWGGGYWYEKPVHNVFVNSFFIGKYEVTNVDYIDFLNDLGNDSSNGNRLIGINSDDCPIKNNGTSFYFSVSAYSYDEQCPVMEVSWFGAIEYCNWLSKQEQLQPAYLINNDSVECNWGANGYRLPTEAEWEYAARSGGRDDRKWSGTNDKNEYGNYAWYWRNSGDSYLSSDVRSWDEMKENNCRTRPVGTKKPNDLGIYDMSGNVSEWCWDWFEHEYYEISPENNPTGPAQGWERVIRGGNWYMIGSNIFRNCDPPMACYNGLGFRIARSILE